MTEIIFKLYNSRKLYIKRVIKNALNSFHIKEKIKTVIIERDSKIDDINVNYSKLKYGEIIISFGKGNRITEKSIFHELGHVWDAIENGLDFSQDKFSERQQIIGGVIINLSLDGRLEKMGIPHYSKSERYKFFNYGNKTFKLGLTKNDFLKLWGANLKKREIMKILNRYTTKNECLKESLNI